MRKNLFFPGLPIRKRTFRSFLLILILAPGLLSAGGKADESLYTVDELIEQGEYNGALETITWYLSTNPEDFDNTELRVRSIFDARNEYMELADELVQVLLNEPENDEKKLAIIARLESMEKNPSAATKNFIAQAKAAAEFTYYRSLFEKLIVQGAEYTIAAKYSDSLDTNAEGFSLYWTNFHESGYQDDFVAAVDGTIEDVRNNIAAYDALVSAINSTSTAYRKAVEAGKLDKISDAFSQFSSCMNRFATIRNNIASDGWFLRDQFALLRQENPELTEASFLPFAYRFILGRASTPSSGMLTALDTHWNELCGSLEPELLALLQKNFVAMSSSFNNLPPEAVAASQKSIEGLLTEVNGTISAVEAFNSIWQLPEKEEGDESVPLSDVADAARYLTDLYASQLVISIRYADAASSRGQTELPADMAALISGNDHAGIDRVISLAESFTAIKKQSEANRQQTAELSVLFSEQAAGKWAAGESILKELCNRTAEAAGNQNASLWQTLADSLLQGDQSITGGYTDIWNEAERLVNRPLDPDVKSYPSELIPVMQDALVRMENDYAAIEGTATTLRQSSEDVNSQLSGVLLCLSELDRIRNAAPELLSLAEERVLLSKRAENEASLRVSEARSALRSENFEAARESLQKSRTKYNEALLYQESDELRQRSDELLAELGNQILRAENEVVVREVRQLKTQAKNAYYQSDFERAENLLIQAQSRWETTNVDDDPEIVSLMSLVGMALSIKTGRTIPVTAPLYPEMSQLLNAANQYYSQAQSLLAQNRRQEAEKLLDQARQKLREVQLVYPLNQEASLLTLRIDQLTDPAAFQEFFARKIDAAKTDYLDTSKRQTVYTDLLDLQEINPSYPGLADFIYKVELALGIRVLPPDTTAIRESERLTAEAQRLFDADSRNEINLNGALTKVNQALEKNADNEAAQILKDRINTALGGSGTTVLSAEAEALYQRAIQELQKGNTLQASVLVAQLLQDPQNKKSSKILDLKKKVDSLL